MSIAKITFIEMDFRNRVFIGISKSGKRSRNTGSDLFPDIEIRKWKIDPENGQQKDPKKSSYKIVFTCAGIKTR